MTKFSMNNRNWEIIELSQEDMRKTLTKYGDKPDGGRYFGLTYLGNRKSYIDKDLCLDQKKQTLKHELMHCYIGCYLFNDERSYTEEDVCNLSANSHDIIHKIVEGYFQNANSE